MVEVKKIQLASGKTRYRAVVDLGRHPETGKRIQKTVTLDTKTAVKNEVARLQNERAQGTGVMPDKITVDEWCERWLEIIRGDIEETSWAGYRNGLISVRRRIGRIPLQQLTEEHVEDMVRYLLTEGRTRAGVPGTGLRVSTVDHSLGRLRQALRMAVRRRLVARNVAEDVVVPRKVRRADRKAHRREEPWDTEEVRSFLVATRDDRLFPIMLVSLMGLRPSEVCGLRWSDIDFETRLMSAGERIRTMGNTGEIEKEAKTEAGERRLPMPAPVTEALKALRKLQAEEKLAAQPGVYQDTGYVLVNEHGETLSTAQLRHYTYGLMKAHGMRRVRLYDARASCLTWLATRGVPDTILARWAGHSSAAITKKYYIKPSPEDLRDAADTLSALFA